MKKSSSKRSGPGTPRGKDLKKPFGFCCEIKNQDLDTRYDKNEPPYKSSMSDIFLNGGGPDLKFRIQDIGKLPHPVKIHGRKNMSRVSLGECNRCRGPLKWYLEDEISLAKDMLAHDKQSKYNSDAEKHLEIAVKKAKRRIAKQREEKRKNKITE